jgi:hypothetical protein
MRPRDKGRFWSNVKVEGPNTSNCWLWTGYRNTGSYGVFWLDGKTRSAHRVAYEEMIGPIPDGLVLDHRCRNPGCVNPFHLEPVTPKVNVRRGLGPGLMSERLKARYRATTHCKYGHEFTPENTYVSPGGRRECRPCNRRRSRERYARKVSARRG